MEEKEKINKKTTPTVKKKKASVVQTKKRSVKGDDGIRYKFEIDKIDEDKLKVGFTGENNQNEISIKLTKEELNKIEAWSMIQLSLTKIANILGVNPHAFIHLCESEPILKTVVARGKAKGIRMVRSKLFEQATRPEAFSSTTIKWLEVHGEIADKTDKNYLLAFESGGERKLGQMTHDDAHEVVKGLMETIAKANVTNRKEEIDKNKEHINRIIDISDKNKD